MPPEILALLCALAFVAGLVDSVVGGGGLVMVPALLAFLPGVPVPTLFGTNKLVSSSGALMAVTRYALQGHIVWRAALPGAVVAFLASMGGAYVVTILDSAIMRPIAVVLLIAIAAHTVAHKEFGDLHLPRLEGSRQLVAGLTTGLVLGFYDGFFGPGAGSFLLFVYVGLFGFSYLRAAACGRLVNMAANMGALVLFALKGHVMFTLAIPLALCAVAGSAVGTTMAVRGGKKIIRVLFLIVVAAVLGKLIFDVIRGA